MKGIPEKLVFLEVRQAPWGWVSRSLVEPEIGWGIRDPGLDGSGE